MLIPSRYTYSSEMEIQDEDPLTLKWRNLQGKGKQAYDEFNSTISRMIEYTQKYDTLNPSDKKTESEIAIKLRKFQETILDITFSPLLAIKKTTFERWTQGLEWSKRNNMRLSALSTTNITSDPIKYYARLMQRDDGQNIDTSYSNLSQQSSPTGLEPYVIIGDSEKEVKEIWEKGEYITSRWIHKFLMEELFSQEIFGIGNITSRDNDQLFLKVWEDLVVKEDRLRREIAYYKESDKSIGLVSTATPLSQEATARLQGILFAKENLKKRYQFLKDCGQLNEKCLTLLESLGEERAKILAHKNPGLFMVFNRQ